MSAARDGMRAVDERLTRALAAIDAANAENPHRVEIGGQALPADSLYGQRMTETLNRVYPHAGDCLAIVARGQHLGRWRVSRKAYPAGRDGYHEWRRHQRGLQAAELARIMAAAGYEADEIARAGVLIRKDRWPQDEDARMLEDVICLVFLEHYLEGSIGSFEAGKLEEIVAKTCRRMTPHGRACAGMLRLPTRAGALVAAQLAAAESPIRA